MTPRRAFRGEVGKLEWLYGIQNNLRRFQSDRGKKSATRKADKGSRRTRHPRSERLSQKHREVVINSSSLPRSGVVPRWSRWGSRAWPAAPRQSSPDPRGGTPAPAAATEEGDAWPPGGENQPKRSSRHSSNRSQSFWLRRKKPVKEQRV